MNNPNEPSDEKLNHLYQARKQRNTAPLNIKRKVLSQQQAPKSLTIIFRRFSYFAATTCTVFLIALLVWQQVTLEQKTQEYQAVQIHSLEKSTEPLSEDIRSRYAQHYQAYLQQKREYAQHHTKHATLNLIDDGWQLTTCDQEVVQLSTELVNALSSINQVDNLLSVGDTVEIVFDQSGIILAILDSKTPLRC